MNCVMVETTCHGGNSQVYLPSTMLKLAWIKRTCHFEINKIARTTKI